MPDFKNGVTVNGVRVPTEIPDGRAVDSASNIHYTVPGIELINTGTRAVIANRIYYAPFFVERAITIDLLAAEVTTLSTGNTRFGIYNADTSWQPTSLVLDAGTIDVTTTGVKTISISQTLQPGRYLSAHNSNGTPTFRTLRGGSKFMGILPAMGTNPFPVAFQVNATYAALASTGVTWGITTASSSPPDHIILFRVSVP